MSFPEPTIQELIDAASTAIHGEGDENADFVRGSDYEALAGPCAILWSRQAERDTDLFDAVNFNTATGDDLTRMALKRYDKVRILDTHGAGTLTLTRPSGTGAETVWTGTRFILTGGIAQIYRATSDVVISSGATTATIPIEAVTIGPGQAVTVSDSSGLRVRIYDILKDSTWKVTALTCADGTLFEAAEAFRSRVRKERIAARVGEEAAIIAACEVAGADNVILFRSNYAGDAYDHGLNVAYVGDNTFTGSPTMVKDCYEALESVRVLGDSMQVFQMAPGSVSVVADVYLIDSPGRFNLDRLLSIHTAAITQYLNGSSGVFAYTLDGILGAIIRNTPEVQRVNITTPTSDASILVGSDKNFPNVLTRYVLSTITLNYLSN